MSSATLLLPRTTPPLSNQQYHPINNISSWKSNTAPSPTPATRREVDYYLNPTELFRWINYRRWDGAKSRAESHPEEVSTWIVSKNTDGGDVKILWRHLPLHLVCMQVGNVGGANSGSSIPNSVLGGANANNPSSQVEELVDVLINIYPDGVSQPDEEGMLPIHQAVANGASERIINLLLLSHPASVNVRDKYNRTPMDIINEIPASSRRDATRMALHRASEKINALASAVRNESADDIAKVQLSAANERVASQRIIMRMEDEVKDANKVIEELKGECGLREERENQYQEEIRILREQLESRNKQYNQLQEEKDEIKVSLETANRTIQDHDKVVQEIKRVANQEREVHIDHISNLKSEVATAKAMAEAMEEQLRSRFAQEEYLNNLVVELENKLHNSNELLEATLKSVEEEKQKYETELEHHRKSTDDLTKKNAGYQSRIVELNKQISSLLASQASFQAEHDRLVEASSRHENDLLEVINNERERMKRSILKQKQFFETLFVEQDVIMEDALKKEKDIRGDYGLERERSLLAVEQLYTQFKTLHAAERERKLKLNSSHLDFYKSVGTPSSGAKSPATDVISNVKPTNMFNSARKSPSADNNNVKPQEEQSSQPLFATPSNRDIQHSSSANVITPPQLQRPMKEQPFFQSPQSVIQPIPQQPSATRLTPQQPSTTRLTPPPPYASSAFNQLNKRQSPIQSYQQQAYYTQTAAPVTTTTSSKSLIVKPPLVEASSSIEKGFEVMHIREETPPFEMISPPNNRRLLNNFHFNTRKAPVVPYKNSGTYSDDDDDESTTPGPVRSGQLLKFLEDRADNNNYRNSPSSSTSSNSNHYSSHYRSDTKTRNQYNQSSPENMRSIALADNTDDYSQADSSSGASSPSSVTGYAYRTTTRLRNTVVTTSSISNHGNNAIGGNDTFGSDIAEF